MPLPDHLDVAVTGGPKWLAARRAEAAEALESSGLPTASEEVWRYSPIDDLDLDRYGRATEAAARALPAAIPAGILVEMGPAGLISTAGAADGLTISSLAEHPEAESLLGSAPSTDEAVESLSTALLGEGLVIDLSRAAMVEQPIVVLHRLGSGIVPSRSIVRLADGAMASVVEIHVGGDGELLSLPMAELLVGDGGSLRYGSVQLLADGAWQLSSISAVLGRDASLSQLTAGLGGAYGRCRTDVLLGGQGASSTLRSTYLGERTQVHDLRTKQDHAAPRTTSDLLCKGAVSDSSRSVYSGLIKMRKGAGRADARQVNHNLVLSEGAHADTVPNLDISENDVRCSHASTVGPIDEDQRYYLESRGIERASAERLLIRGFFADLLERSEVGPGGPLASSALSSRLETMEVS